MFTSKSLIVPAKWKRTAIVLRRLIDTEPLAPSHLEKVLRKCYIYIEKYSFLMEIKLRKS